MPIDQQLIDLWKGKKNPLETFLDRWHYKRLSPESKKDLKYFLNSDSRSVKSEPYAFLREQREKMLDRGILGETYDKITPFKMWQARRAAAGNTLGNFAEGDRIAKFLPWWKYNRFSKIANTAPAVIPAVGAGVGAGLLLNQDGTPQQAYGGPIGSIYGYRNYDNDMLTNKANGGDISIPDLDTSNWLKKYKVGGPGLIGGGFSTTYTTTINPNQAKSDPIKVESTGTGVSSYPLTPDDETTWKEGLNEGKQWLKDWYAKRATLPQFKTIANQRLRAMNKNYIGFGDMDPNESPGATAFYSPSEGNVHFQMNDPYSFSAATLLHEYLHGLDDQVPQDYQQFLTKKNLIPEKKFNKTYTGKNATNPDFKYPYYSDPTEVRARLNTFRRRYNIDPSKQYTKEDMQNIINHYRNEISPDPDKAPSDFQYEKRSGTSDNDIDQLLDILGNDPAKLAELNNTIVMNTPKNQTTAKYGGASTGWLGKYETGSEVTDTTTIKPGWSLMSAVPEWHANGTTTIQKPVVKKVTETPKKLPQKSYVGKPATQEEWANSNNNVNTQVTATGAYRLPTDAEWENVQRKKGININTGRTIAPGWNLGGGDKIAVTQPSLTEAQKFQFENPYTTPNPNLDDSDPRTPDYWWSKAGWNPEKQQTPEGVAAFARLYPQFATADSDREWTTLPDGRSAWKKRVHPWQIPGTPQYKALTEINELETEKNNLIAKTVVQLADPTGVTMWGDTWDSYKELYNHPSVWNATLAGVNTIASLPFVKYFGEEAMIPVKGAETATKVANITSKLEKLYTKYPELSKLQKAMNVGEKVVGAGKKSLNYLNNSAAGKLVHYVGGEPFMKTFDKATGAEKLFKLPTTGAIQGFNKMERFGKASINLPLNLYANNQNIKDLKNSLNSGGLFYNFQRPNGTTFQISKEIQDKQLPGSIPFDAIDANYDGKNEIIPIYDDKTLNSMDIYIPAMYNNSQKTQPKLKKLPNKK